MHLLLGLVQIENTTQLLHSARFCTNIEVRVTAEVRPLSCVCVRSEISLHVFEIVVVENTCIYTCGKAPVFFLRSTYQNTSMLDTVYSVYTYRLFVHNIYVKMYNLGMFDQKYNTIVSQCVC